MNINEFYDNEVSKVLIAHKKTKILCLRNISSFTLYITFNLFIYIPLYGENVDKSIVRNVLMT